MKLNLTDEQIIAVLDQIALDEFERNYNKSEMARVAEELCFKDERALKLENKIRESFPEDAQVRVNVSNFGTLTISVPASEYGSNCWTYAKRLSYAVELPYAYVMGRKVGKRNMQAVMDQHVRWGKSTLKLIED